MKTRLFFTDNVGRRIAEAKSSAVPDAGEEVVIDLFSPTSLPICSPLSKGGVVVSRKWCFSPGGTDVALELMDRDEYWNKVRESMESVKKKSEEDES